MGRDGTPNWGWNVWIWEYPVLAKGRCNKYESLQLDHAV